MALKDGIDVNYSASKTEKITTGHFTRHEKTLLISPSHTPATLCTEPIGTNNAIKNKYLLSINR